MQSIARFLAGRLKAERLEAYSKALTITNVTAVQCGGLGKQTPEETPASDQNYERDPVDIDRAAFLTPAIAASEPFVDDAGCRHRYLRG